MTRTIEKYKTVPSLAVLFCCGLFSSNVMAVKYSIESRLNTQIGYNDNIFLTILPHDAVSNLSVIPSAKIVAEEKNWNAFINGKFQGNQYSDSEINSNDVYLDLSSKYNQELNIYTLAGSYDKDSNLNIESTDFGVAGRRINRTLWNIAPQYQRLVTERITLFANYNHVDVDYADSSGTGYIPYSADILGSSLVYGLTENDKLSFTLQGTDYSSKDNAIEYQLFIARVDVESALSDLWVANISIGASRRNSTNTITQTFDFFGQPITLDQVTDFTSRGYVLNAGISKKFESGKLTANISRDDVTNSFGGLNEVDKLSIKYDQNITSIWSYNIESRYEKNRAVSVVERTTDRDIFIFKSQLFYKLDRNWTMNAAYRYIQRKFISDTSADRTPNSNMIYIGMTYNFPEISTF